MRNYLLFILVSMLMGTIFPICSFADDGQTVEIPTVVNPGTNPDLNPEPKNDPDPYPNEPPKGLIPNRIPSRPVMISITEGLGVTIPGVDKEDVISYGIYKEDGTLVAIFDDDIAFAQAVFSMTGVIEIRIALDGYSLCGWMEN